MYEESVLLCWISNMIFIRSGVGMILLERNELSIEKDTNWFLRAMTESNNSTKY